MAAPADAGVYWRAGQLAMRKGDVEKAIGFLQHATKMDPSHAGVWMSLGVALANGAGDADSGAVCLSMAAAKAAAAAGSGAQVPWPATTLAVARTNLHELAKKHRLWPPALASRMADARFADFLAAAVSEHLVRARLFIPASDAPEPNQTTRLQICCIHTCPGEALAVRRAVSALACDPTFQTPLTAVEVIDYHSSSLMQVVSARTTSKTPDLTPTALTLPPVRLASDPSDLALPQTPEPGPPTEKLLVTGSSLLPGFSGVRGVVEGGGVASWEALGYTRVTVVKELVGCLVESDDLYALNSVDVREVGRLTGCEHLEDMVAGLQAAARPCQADLWKHRLLTEPTVLATTDISEPFPPRNPTAFTCTSAGTCVGIVAWVTLSAGRGRISHSYAPASARNDTSAAGRCPPAFPVRPHVWQHVLYRVAPGSVAPGDRIEVDVRIDGAGAGCKVEARFEGEGAPSVELDARLPPYHAVMLNDHARTRAYADGLRQVCAAAARRKLVAPDASATGTKGSSTVAPDASASDAKGSSTAAADISASDTKGPSTAAADVSASDTKGSSTSAADASASDAKGPSTAAADVSASDTKGPSTVAADTSASDAKGPPTAAADASAADPRASSTAASDAKGPSTPAAAAPAPAAEGPPATGGSGGVTVVDLGCGTGLLSLLSVRAGCRSVYAVERFVEIARIADRVFRKNGLGPPRCVLVPKHSSDVAVGPPAAGDGGSVFDVPGPPDVAVHEIFGTDPLSEGLLPALRSARASGLISPATLLCPGRFRVWAAAASSPELLSHAGIGGGTGLVWPGFVSPRKLEVDLAKISDLQLHTEPAVVWEVDLSGEVPLSGSLPVALPAQAGVGSAAARFVVHWFDFLCGDDAWYSTAPRVDSPHPVAHWVQNVEILPEPLAPVGGVYNLRLTWATDRIVFLPSTAADALPT
ncbi:Protein arginine N-methyltransferase 7 [Diplonema papillatum]|nr:Protein arginine N-methyltransferase 7 [Diplonema papillatum]